LAQPDATDAADSSIDAFIERWSKAGGSERANYQLFLTELCALLGLPTPDPASGDNRDNAYVFERRVVMREPDGSPATATSTSPPRRLRARGQAERQGPRHLGLGQRHGRCPQAGRPIRARPARRRGRPPFIVVVDGRNIELYAEFSRSGGSYTAFPDPSTSASGWPTCAAPTSASASAPVARPDAPRPLPRIRPVTRQIADQLAALAKSLEAGGHGAEDVASFLMRALFTMFAEDVGLLPSAASPSSLSACTASPPTSPPCSRACGRA
jgi:hypothetical protein